MVLTVGMGIYILEYLPYAEVTPTNKRRHSAATDSTLCGSGNMTLVVFSSVFKERIKIHKFHNEYSSSKEKFYKLKNGFKLQNEEYNLIKINRLVPKIYTETEWGFPKGRRNLRESDLDCAKTIALSALKDHQVLL